MSRPDPAPSLFDHSAELRAIQTGRPLHQERMLLAGIVDDPQPGPLFTPPALAAEDDRRGRYAAGRYRPRAAWAASGLRGPRPPDAGPSPCFFHRCTNPAAVRCCGCRHAFCLPCARHADHPCPLCHAAAGWSTEATFEPWADCAAAAAFSDTFSLLPPKDRSRRLL